MKSLKVDVVSLAEFSVPAPACFKTFDIQAAGDKCSDIHQENWADRNPLVTRHFKKLQRKFVNFGKLKLDRGLLLLWIDPTLQGCCDLAFGPV